MKKTLFSVLVCALGAGAAIAQPVRNRILRSLTVQERSDGHLVQVNFDNPIRYLRHSPRSRGRELEVQLQHLALSPAELVPATLRESLRPPPDSGAPLESVEYDGTAPGEPVLDIRFTKSVEFEVHQGEDLRSLSIVILEPSRPRVPRPQDARKQARVPPARFPELPPMPAPPDLALVPIRLEDRFAVELEVVEPGAAPSPPPDDPLFERYRLYRIPVQAGDQISYRYRLGFLPSKKAAKQALARLRAAYPNAAAVPTSRAERVASAGRAVSAAALRSATRPSLPVTPAPPSPARAPTGVAGLLERGRAAMTGGDLDLAVRLFTAIVEKPEVAGTREARQALELLGVARERRGQLAHAKAEYETYLARYPDGEGAERVRQRLEAMLTRSEPARAPRRPARREDTRWDVSTFGSLYSSYYRGDLVDKTVDQLISTSVAFTDLNLSTRMRKGDYDVRARGAASYRYDIPLDTAIDEFRLDSLFVEASDRGRGLEGSIGRQSANSGGVLGRFDGLRLGVTVLDGWKLSSVGGLPVDIARAPTLDTERIFTGVAIDTPRFFESVQGQVWAIGQQARGLWDREAVGAELRYVAPSRFFAGFLDYDVHFGVLNTALLIGNWNLSPDTSFNFTLDHRTTPVLTLENALIGQPLDSFRQLRSTFTGSQIEQLAVDRTARSSLAMLGVTHHLTEGVQLAGDATVTHLSGTQTSGGVAATRGTGIEYALGLRLLANGVFLADDVTTVGVRAFVGDLVDSYTLQLGTRLPVSDALRLYPLVLLRYDQRNTASDSFGVEPGIRFDLHVWKLDLDSDVTLQWRSRSGGVAAGNEYGYRAQIGIRYDFQ